MNMEFSMRKKVLQKPITNSLIGLAKPFGVYSNPKMESLEHFKKERDTISLLFFKKRSS